MDDLKQEKSNQHFIQSLEILNIVKLSHTSETNGIYILGRSDTKDNADVEMFFPLKNMHAAEESKKTELKDCEFESSHEPVLQLSKLEKHSINSLIQASKSHRPQIEGTSDNILPTGMSSRELEDAKDLGQCKDYLVKKGSTNLCKENQYVPCAKTKSYEKCLGEKIEPSGGAQILYAIVEKGTRKQLTLNGSTSNELRLKEMNKLIKCIDILSSCLEEVGRMNDIFNKEVTKIHSELAAINESIRYLSKSLNVIKYFPVRTVLYKETDRHLSVRVNVYRQGVILLKDLNLLFIKMKNLLVEFNDFRLEFIKLSESFSYFMLELCFNNQQNKISDWIEGVKKVYNKFFDNDAYETLHKRLRRHYKVLKRVFGEFEILLKMLIEQVIQKITNK